ncbi:MAG: S16 family serine protease [Acidimicrobiales bacterium]
MLWTVLVVVVFAAVVASKVDLNYYAIQPGSAESVQPFITVPVDKAHPVKDPVLLTDVREARVTALTYLYFRLESDTALYSLPSVTGGTAPSELDAQGALEMTQAEQAAKTSALRYLGYTVPATPAGAVIAGTFVGTPAYGVLDVGDVVTAVDGTPTPTAEALTTALATRHPGQAVTFSVRKGGTGAPVPVPIVLRRTKVNVDGEDIYLDVGIEPEDQVDYTYPFPISIDVVDIGGPSAGLAMTLGVIDTLSGGSLTGGHTVAATGTMDAAGDVGDVGGVAQKTVAVENAGATIFLVPPQEYQAALSEDRPGLKIYPVSSLEQALQVLQENGGHVATTALDAASSASAG